MCPISKKSLSSCFGFDLAQPSGLERYSQLKSQRKEARPYNTLRPIYSETDDCFVRAFPEAVARNKKCPVPAEKRLLHEPRSGNPTSLRKSGFLAAR